MSPQRTVTGRQPHSVSRYFILGGGALAVLIFFVGGSALMFLEMARLQTKSTIELYWPRSVGAQRLAVDASNLTALISELPTAASDAERQTVLQRVDGMKAALAADLETLRAAKLGEEDLAPTIKAEQALIDGADRLDQQVQVGIALNGELARQADLVQAGCKPSDDKPDCRALLTLQSRVAENEQRRVNLSRRQSELARRFLFLASSQSDDAAAQVSSQNSQLFDWAVHMEWLLGATMLIALLLLLGLRSFFKKRIVQRIHALETAMVNWRKNEDWRDGVSFKEEGQPDEIDAMAQALRDLLQEIAHQTVELTRSNAELEQFAYVASHDLRQPLRMVSSYLSLIERRLKDSMTDETREFFAFASGGAKKMDRLILDLLDYSRIGRRDMPPEPVPLAEVVNEALLNLRPAIAEAEAAITVAPDLPVVSGHRSELVRLFQNLIGNAVKYRAPERAPVIFVTCQASAEGWTVTVRDNGIGIAVDQAERVFLVFQRLHTSKQYEGTGIGLALCRKIIEHIGGRIWVQPAEGGGSEFIFTLPGSPAGQGTPSP